MPRDALISGDPMVTMRPAIVDAFLSDHADLTNPFGLLGSCDATTFEPLTHEPNSLVQAFTLDESFLIPIDERWGQGYFLSRNTEDDLTSNQWVFAGFEVLEAFGLISGLNGCGYENSTKNILIKLFAGHVNQNGLFDSYDAALEFSVVRGLQIRAHAPFVPCGIFYRG